MFRRDCKLFFRCLAAASLLMLILVLVCALAAGAVVIRSGQVYTPAEIAVIDHEDSVISRILIGMVKGSDYISELLSVKTMEEDAAMEALRRGECAAVVVLPEGFLEDILRGRESEGVIYLSEAASSQAAVVEAVAKFGERLLIAGQAGVFAGEFVIGRNNLGSEEMLAFQTESNMALMEEAVGASGRYFRQEVLYYLDTGMPAASYYGMCWLILLLFLISLFFAPLFQRDGTPEMLRRLRTVGVGNAAFMRWKLLLPALFRLLIVFAVLAAAGAFLQISWSVTTVVSAAVSVCFVTLVGTAVTMCLGDGITANVIFGLFGMVMVGGLVPRQLLPDTVTVIGDLTPFGAAVSLMKPAFGAECSHWAIGFAVVYSAAAILLIRRTLNRTARGG